MLALLMPFPTKPGDARPAKFPSHYVRRRMDGVAASAVLFAIASRG